ncbi:MAG: exodeoxyribonuclease VII large subunit [Gammaproteobacteria bacterium]|nr:MAG: exodeoxyribonuclease VII large subunit [Gammaproteobacteria bacterium]
MHETADNSRHVFSVSELNQYAKETLENTFPMIWVEAEVSNLVQPSSGHIYLTLKDKNAQIRAAMFKGRNQRLQFKPKNGDQVLVKGRLSLYAPRGDYQLIVDCMEEAGLGALQRAFEALKNKLASEGLFDDDLKQPLPDHPERVGVVTSPTGAAIQDIISVLNRRFPLLPIVVYPCAVQGEDAPQQIIHAIEQANRREECDVLIVGRGGGSLEDLWAFNDEALARTIANSTIPIVSAVGHQIDFTIADFVADVRAPTPSAAAEMLSQDQMELLGWLAGYESALTDKIMQRLAQANQQLEWLGKRLQHPGRKLEEHLQRLDTLESRLQLANQHKLQESAQHFGHLLQRLTLQRPDKTIEQHLATLGKLERRLVTASKTQTLNHAQRLSFLAQQLNAVSPLATLGRGYAIMKDDKDKIIRTTEDTKPGAPIKAHLKNGVVHCEVTHIENTLL